VAKSPTEVARYVTSLKLRNYTRDQRMGNVRAARAGEIQRIMPGMLPDAWPKPIVKNIIDNAARLFSEQAGVMPLISCTAGVMVSDRQKKYAQKRTLVANHYVGESRLKKALVPALDWYDTYGFLPIIAEPHFGDDECQAGPRVRFENPLGCYYDLDAYGKCKTFVKVYTEDVGTLAKRFPHLASKLVDSPEELTTGRQLEMVMYMDHEQSMVLLPAKNNLVIMQMANAMGKLTVEIAERAKFDGESRGSYDDTVWIHLAKARFAMYGLEAAKKSVYAPLAIPSDVQSVPLGPDAIIRSNTPEKIRKVGMEMSPAAFQIGQLLDSEASQSARLPGVSEGKSPGSIVTGAGVDALNGTIDLKVKTAQEAIGYSLSEVLTMCFEMDEKFWPNTPRYLRVKVNGNTYEEQYVPSKDIAGVHQVDVTYGMAAGMDPNRALVFLLQLRGDKGISRDFMLRNMPFDVNIDQEMEKVDNEELDDALKQGIAGLAGAVPQLVLAGQDPMDLITKLANIGKQREKGLSLRDAVLKAFAPKTPPPGSMPPGAAEQAPGAPPGPPGMPGPGMQAPGGGAPPGPGGMGAPQQQQQPQPGQPGGQSVMDMLASLGGGGQPQLNARTSRKVGGP
jgi:hypothetical protein